MRTKILVCGATGFIGRNIAEALAGDDACEVYGTCLNSPPLNHPKIKMLKCDLTSKTDVARVVAGMDVIVQAAACTSGSKEILSKPYYHVTDNAIMNSLIFRAAFENKVKHVLFFSCTVMYPSSDVPAKEEDFKGAEMHPSYFGSGWTKVYIEKMCEFYSRIGDTKYTVMRHSNIYGPYDKFDLERSHVFGATITKVLAAKEGGEIVVWGGGEEKRDLLYVDDLVDFVKLAISRQTSRFELLNVGCGSAIAVKDLVAKIIALSGKKLKLTFDLTKPTIKTGLCVDASKARRTLGWEKRTGLDEGILKTMKWHREHISGPGGGKAK